MKRARIDMEAIASWNTLCEAFHLSARGMGGRGDVEAFRSRLEPHLEELGGELRAGIYQPRPMRRFSIRDPKPRIIHAPDFRDRVVHHALMLHVAPVLDRVLSGTSFACRPGMGVLAAANHAKRQCRHGRWHAQVDIAQYFPSIPHEMLLERLATKFSDHDVLRLFEVILAGHEDTPGTGLPIGALTSQWFANFYLSQVDRLLEGDRRVLGQVRYMDDIVWWCPSRQDAGDVLDRVMAECEALGLALKPGAEPRPSSGGLVFCGCRLVPGVLLLSQKQRRRFRKQLAEMSKAVSAGRITGAAAQRRMDAILSTVDHARASSWRGRVISANDVALVT